MLTIRTAWGLFYLTYSLSVGSRKFDPENWMRMNMEWLGRRPLKQICIPGSHNSGMSKLHGGTMFVRSCNVLNQSRTVRMQLELGVRYFDVRPVISRGTFMTGHYNKLLGGVWLGGNGQFIGSIVEDINDFTKDHNELIIVSLSHSLNTDVRNKGLNRYRRFDQTEWNSLFDHLDRTDNLFFAPASTFLPKYTLRNLTDNGKRAAVIFTINEDDVKLKDRLGKGYFHWMNTEIYDQYAGTDKVSVMFEDQIKKMKLMSHKRYFLLSWTLTQNPIDALLCPLRKSILNLAKEANKNLYKILIEASEAAYPNIISVDGIETSEVAELSVAINYKILMSTD